MNILEHKKKMKLTFDDIIYTHCNNCGEIFSKKNIIYKTFLFKKLRFCTTWCVSDYDNYIKNKVL